MDSDNFEMTEDEMRRIKEAMKDKQFVDLLLEYTKEISDPENKKKYEAEILAMEKQRGNENVKLLQPQPGFVLKTSRSSDGMKVFVNICTSGEVADFSVKDAVQNGITGSHISLPHYLIPVREDLDKAGKSCLVFDVCFNPNSYAKSLTDSRFKQLMVDSALDTVEKQGNIKLDRQNQRFPKMKYKGTAKASIIRPPSDSATNAATDIIGEVCAEVKSNAQKDPERTSTSVANTASSKNEKVTPQYTVKHRGYFDMQNFTLARESYSNIPKELVVEINLPSAESAASIDLDIFEKELVLDSEVPAYHLEISLPYSVNDTEGKAQFNTTDKTLVVTLPVIVNQQKDLITPELPEPVPLVQEIPADSYPSTEEEGTHPCKQGAFSNGESTSLSDRSSCDNLDTDDGDHTLEIEPASQLNNEDYGFIENDHEGLGIEHDNPSFGTYQFDSLVSRLTQALQGEQEQQHHITCETGDKVSHTAEDTDLTHSADEQHISVFADSESSCTEEALTSTQEQPCTIDILSDAIAETSFDNEKCATSEIRASDDLLRAEIKSTDCFLGDVGDLVDDGNIEDCEEEDEDDDCFLQPPNVSPNCKVASSLAESPTKSILKRSNSEQCSEDDISSPYSPNKGSSGRFVVSKARRKLASESDTDYCDTEDDVSSLTPEHKYCDFGGAVQHIIPRYSKSDGEYCDGDTEDDLSYMAHSHGDLAAAGSLPSPRRRRIKSVTFDDKPTIFEFDKVSKRQLKKQRKQERRRQVYDEKHSPGRVSHTESSEFESTEGEVSDNEQQQKGNKQRKKGKRGEKKNMNYSNGLPPVPKSILSQTSDEDTSQKKKKKRKNKKNKEVVSDEKVEDHSSMSDNLPASSEGRKELGSLSNQLIFELE